jgi:hypothetical protein
MRNMRKSISELSSTVTSEFGAKIGFIGLSSVATAPKVGTHFRYTKRINGKTVVEVRHDFLGDLSRQGSVNELKSFLARHIRIDGQRVDPSRILIFGPDRRTLHGKRHI